MPQIHRIFPPSIRWRSRIEREESLGIAIVVEDDGQDQGSDGDGWNVIVLRDAQLLCAGGFNAANRMGKNDEDLLDRRPG